MKWLIIILMVFAMIEVADALCFPGTLDNPFCIFESQEVQAEQQNSGGSISLDFTPIPSVTDLNFNRTFDKINITWNGKTSYATIQIQFYYAGDGKRYFVAEAQSFGARFNDWVVSNSGNSLKWGGIANVSGISSTIKTNGFYPVFELIESQNADISKDEDKLWLGNDVYIEWKDYNNPSNIFKVWNKTTVYLTNNNELFHDTVIYDPVINVTSGTNWVLNQSILNTTAHPDWIECNSSYSNCTSITPVSCNSSFIYFWNMSYGNFNTTEYIELSNVNGTCIQAKALQDRDNNDIAMSVRTKNITYNHTGELLNFGLDNNYTNVNFVDNYADYDINGQLKNGIEFNNSCVVDGCYSFTGLSNKHIQVPNFPETENLTCMAWIKTKGTSNQQILSQSGHPYLGQFYLTSGQDLVLQPGGLTFRNLDSDPVNGYFFTIAQQNTWAHIALTVNVVTQNYTVYKNGTWWANRTAVPPAASGTGTLFIGVYSDGISEEFNGWIDEIKCFSRVLVKDEIKSIYDQEKSGFVNWTSFTSPQKASTPTANHRLQNISIAYETYAKPTGEAPPVLDTTKPIINGTLNKSITTIYQNDIINFTANFTDNSGNVTWANFSINTTSKQYYNFSIEGSSLNTRQISQNITINMVAGNVLNASWKVSDNSSNMAQNDTVFTVASLDDCSCPASGDWVINDGSNCVLTTECDLGGNKFYCDDGTLTINGAGKLIANGGAIKAGCLKARAGGFVI